MRVVVVEDESLVAERIVRLIKQVLSTRLRAICIQPTLQDAMSYLDTHSIDLLFLDLSLNGKDGFELLKQAAAATFHTIVISANTDKAITAFEYGVLDFIGKPFTVERLTQACERYHRTDRRSTQAAKYLAVRKGGGLVLLDVEEIDYAEGCDIYARIHLQNGTTILHDKSLRKLAAILPAHFLRIHKSYIVNLRQVVHFKPEGNNRYGAALCNGKVLPVGRAKYREIKHQVI